MVAERVAAIQGRLPAALVDLANRLQERLIAPEALPPDITDDAYVQKTLSAVLAALRPLQAKLEEIKIPGLLDHLVEKATK